MLEFQVFPSRSTVCSVAIHNSRDILQRNPILFFATHLSQLQNPIYALVEEKCYYLLQSVYCIHFKTHRISIVRFIQFPHYHLHLHTL